MSQRTTPRRECDPAPERPASHFAHPSEEASHPPHPVNGIQATDGDKPGPDAPDGVRCPLPRKAPGLDVLTQEFCSFLEDAGCPLALPVQARLRFETLLADLSATFVNLPAGQVD